MTGPAAEEPTPAELRQLAGEAEALAGRIAAVQARLSESGVTIRRTGFRLDDSAGEIRRAARELGDTASDLARTRLAQHPDLCQAEWGVCPEHGNTLTSSGGGSRCRVDGRTWGYDRLGLPCGEPLTDVVMDPQGDEQPMCHGHALAIRGQTGWSTRPIVIPDA